MGILPARHKLFIGILAVSYALVWMIFNILLVNPQRRTLAGFRQKKARIEYDFLKIKNTPQFIAEVAGMVQAAEAKRASFLWLTETGDPNLALFDHLSRLAEQRHLVLAQMQRKESVNPGGKKTPYFFWQVRFEGTVLNMMLLMDDIENSPHYLKITELDLAPGEDGKALFTIIIAGLKKQG